MRTFARGYQALRQAREEEIVFLPRAPKLRYLAEMSWAKDPLRVGTPQRREAEDEVVKLPELWAGQHLAQWEAALAGGDGRVDEQFGQKLKERFDKKHEAWAKREDRKKVAAQRAQVGVQKRVAA